jgi:hypothetical protein
MMIATRPWIGVKILSIILVFFVLASYAAQQDAGAAVTLAYQFPDGKTISYRQASTEKQYMQINGQDINTLTQSSLEFSAKSKGMKDSNFGLGVTIDAMKISVQGPQGDLSPDLSQILGKSFEMTLSRLGKELDTSGAAAIKYQLGPTASRDLSPGFQAFFPDLADRPVKKGDTWTSQDKVTQNTGSGEILVSAQNVHTVDGFETVDGIECARIKTATTGTLKGNLEEGGVGLTLDCKIEGTGTWYFAIKEGVLVKADNKGSYTGAITAGEPANLSIPLSGETLEETRLIKK